MTYKITNLEPGGNHEDDRRDWIYARLIDEKGILHVSATLEYILAVIPERNYQVTNLLEVLTEVEKLYSQHRLMFTNEEHKD